MSNYINVPVPEHLVPAVMTLISEQMTPAPVATSGAEWSESELRKLWNESGPRMKKILALLAENGKKAVPGGDLAKVIGKEKKGHSISGMMGALGRRLKHRHGGKRPFAGHWNADLHRWEYVMPLANAEHILKFVPPKEVP